MTYDWRWELLTVLTLAPYAAVVLGVVPLGARMTSMRIEAAAPLQSGTCRW